MNRIALAALSLLPLLAVPLAAQTVAQSPAATITAPPAGFAQSIVLWPNGAPMARGKTEGDIPKLFTYPTAGAGAHGLNFG